MVWKTRQSQWQVYLQLYIPALTCTSHVFLSASFMCYSMLKFLPEGYSDVTWTDWFIWALPWSIVALGLTTIATYFYYKPTEKINLNKNFIANKIVELEPGIRVRRLQWQF